MGVAERPDYKTISDDAVRLNVQHLYQRAQDANHKIVTSTPALADMEEGHLYIVDTGSGTRQLIIRSGGIRYTFNGTAI